jgi:hypothetical protein
MGKKKESVIGRKNVKKFNKCMKTLKANNNAVSSFIKNTELVYRYLCLIEGENHQHPENYSPKFWPEAHLLYC